MSEPKKGDVRITMDGHPQTAAVDVFDGAGWIRLRCKRVELDITPTAATAKIDLHHPHVRCRLDGRSITVTEHGQLILAEREAGV